MKSRSNELVVILSPGRTGSSLLTRVFLAMGMAGSKNFLEGVEFNPEGVFEDTEIVDVHKEIFAFLAAYPYAPLPDDFLNTKGIQPFSSKLQEIVKKNIASTDGLWGFKDPRTASLLPLWIRVFNSLKLAPKYILSTRNLSAVVNSLHRQFNDSHEIGELVWLVRTCDALYYSGGNCFIVHYEKWFDDGAADLVRNLAAYVGLSEAFKNEDEGKFLSGILNKSLNRSGIEKYEVRNPLVRKLYRALQQCHGNDFDHDRLMKVAIECREQIANFKPFLLMGERSVMGRYQKAEKKNRELKSQNLQLVSQLKAGEKELSSLRDDSAKLHGQVNELSEDIVKLRADNSALTSQIIAQANDIKSLQDERSKLAEKSAVELKDWIKLERESSILTADIELRKKEIAFLQEEKSKLAEKSALELKDRIKLERENSVLTAELESQLKSIESLRKEQSLFADRASEQEKNLQLLRTENASLVEQLEIKKKEIVNLQNEKQAVVDRAACLKKQVEALNKDLHQSTVLIQKQKDSIRKLRASIENCRSSVSFKIGQTFVNAVDRPGKATILFPYYFIKTVLEGLFTSKRVENNED